MKEDSAVIAEPKKEAKFWGPVPVVVITILLFLASQFIASLVFILISTLLGWDHAKFSDWYNASAFPQFIYVMVAYVIVIIGVYLLVKKKGYSLRYIGVAKPRLSDAGKALLAYGVYMIIFITVTTISKKLAPSLNLEQQQQLGFTANKGVMNLIYAGISLVILPPLAEELLCRGFLYTGLRTKLKIIPAAIITSIIFASAHLQFGSGAPLLWVAAIDTFVLSLVLVYLRETTGKLTSSIFLHMIKNAVAFSILFIFVS